MSKAVLISIQPKWCKKIVEGEKTIEVRKTRPAVYKPFKCYIYCTYGKGLIERNDQIYPNVLLDQTVSRNKTWGNCCNGKVIGEFMCYSIEEYHADEVPFGEYDIDVDVAAAIGMTGEELWTYGKGVALYGWRISNLVIYDKTKELREFYNVCPSYGTNFGICWGCENAVGEEFDCGVNGKIAMTKPPQSWCYVEEGQGDVL